MIDCFEGQEPLAASSFNFCAGPTQLMTSQQLFFHDTCGIASFWNQFTSALDDRGLG